MNLSNERNFMIKKEGNKYKLYSKDGSKILGTFDTKEQATKREQQIQYFKNKGKFKNL